MQEVVQTAADNWWAAPALLALMAACNLGRKWLTGKKGK
jgi:hypothetical protein